MGGAHRAGSLAEHIDNEAVENYIIHTCQACGISEVENSELSSDVFRQVLVKLGLDPSDSDLFFKTLDRNSDGKVPCSRLLQFFNDDVTNGGDATLLNEGDGDFRPAVMIDDVKVGLRDAVQEVCV